ncbi:MAG: hypothetical protein EP326_02185 [Deltaproteobacteria bacterium]|nr:MAG: hypothetical protein EP326_02185 [Deltaproteobacteria bacterium]
MNPVLKKMTLLILFILGLCFQGCSGYRVKNSENPLAIYGIRTLAIPVFVNHSTLSKISGPLTTEIKSLMMSYVDLRVQSEYRGSSDAVLLGIIESPKHKNETVKATGSKFTTGDIEATIGTRNEFFIPQQNEIKLVLRLILIKAPSAQELELAKGDLGKFMKSHPRVIFSENMDVTAAFSREIAGNLSPDNAGVVNFSKNKKAQYESLRLAAKSVATNFKEVVLDAF